MKTHLGSSVAVSLALSLSCALAQDPQALRTWVDQTGRTLKARLLNVQGTNVVLQLDNNTTATVPLARFSNPDQSYVKGWAKGASKPDPTVVAKALKWPESAVVDVKKLQIVNGEQNAAARRFVYQSGSFQFTSNAALTGVVMREIAGDFELVREFFAKVPWGWQPKPEGGGPLFLAELYETQKDFINAGGDDQSSGWSKDGLIFTKFSTLGLKKVGERYARDPKLSREGEMIGLITRLVMGDMRDLTLPWSALGLERFLEDVTYRNGAFQLANPERGLKEMIANGQDLAPDVDGMLKLLHGSWAEDRGREVVAIRRQNYFNGAMLIYFFGYLDGDGTGTRLHRYYQAMAQDAMAFRNYREARKAGDNSVPNPKPNTSYPEWAASLNTHVIDGRSDEQLRTEIVAKYKAIGIKM